MIRFIITWLVAAICVSTTTSSVAASATETHTCFLPLGDSLTQGVGNYGAYRHHLYLQLMEKMNLSPITGFSFIGSQRYTCTPKHPNIPYEKEELQKLLKRREDEILPVVLEGGDSLPQQRKLRQEGKLPDLLRIPHQGHCGFSSSKLLADLPHLFKSESFQESLQQAAGVRYLPHSNETSAPTKPNCTRLVVTLLIGHNDVFQVAKLCKVPEFATSPPIRVGGDGSSGNTMSRCVEQHLVKNSGGFRSNLLKIIRRVQEAFPSRDPDGNPGGVRDGVHFFIGLNPSTGFPIVHSVLLRAIRDVAEEVRGSEDDQERSSSGNVVKLVEFTGWGKSNTFDSTHPNDSGCKLMAGSFFQAIARSAILKGSTLADHRGKPDTVGDRRLRRRGTRAAEAPPTQWGIDKEDLKAELEKMKREEEEVTKRPGNNAEHTTGNGREVERFPPQSSLVSLPSMFLVLLLVMLGVSRLREKKRGRAGFLSALF